MIYGPSHFEDAQDLLDFITNDVLGENRHDHPLRRAISDHIHAQDISEAHPSFTAFRKLQTFNADIKLNRIFDEKSNADVADLNDTLKEHIVHCFWDGIRKDSGNLRIALEPGMEEIKESIVSDTDDPRKKRHFKMVATLRNHISKYGKLFGNLDGEASDNFNAALSYMEEQLLPEMERILGEEFVTKTPNSPEDPRQRFQSQWAFVARQFIEWGKIEGIPVETPSRIPGKEATQRHTNSFGFEGLSFDEVGLRL